MDMNEEVQEGKLAKYLSKESSADSESLQWLSEKQYCFLSLTELWTEYVLPKFICWNPNPQCDGV